MGEDEEHFRKSREHFEKGTQKVLKQGLKRGKKQRRKLDYYNRNRSEFIREFSRKLGNPKKPAIAGTVVVAPILITLLVVDWLFSKIEAIPGNQFFNLTGYYHIDQSIKLGIFLFVGAVIVTGVGRFVSTGKGFEVEKIVDRVFDRIPFLGSIYNISKVSIETVLGGAEDLREPVKIEFQGARITGFKTGNTSKDGRPIIFIPTAPNITTGFVVELEASRIIETEENTEEALTRIFSAGFGSGGKEAEEN